MFKMRKDPIWLVYIAGLVVALLYFIDPANRSVYLFLLAGVAFFFILRLVFRLLKKTAGSPVPDSAVKEMFNLYLRNTQDEEWILARFSPKVSLAEARLKVGSQAYSDKDRLQGFMTKFSLIAPSRKDVAILYSPEKGVLLAHYEIIQAIENKYGRWMLDTWYPLVRGMKRLGMDAVNLDGPQTLSHGRHVDSSSFGR